MTCEALQPITVTIAESDVNSVMISFDMIQVFRSVNGLSGVYTEITAPGTRPRLETNKTQYEYIDKEGAVDYYYKYRYFNSVTNSFDTFSDAERGEPDPALNVISIQELKDIYLWGVDLTNDQGVPYPTSMYAWYIKAAVDWLEKKLDIPIIPRTYTDERHDFFKDDYNKYIWLKLTHSPVIAVNECKLVLPGEQVVKVFEKEWLHIQRFDGQLQMVPGTGTAGTILLGASGAWIPLIYGNNKFIPDAFRVNYECGFGRPSNPNGVTVQDPELDQIPSNIRHLVGMLSAIGPFNVAGDMIAGAGIASTSIGIDGLSQSVSTTACFTGDTMVLLSDVTAKAIKEMVGGKFDVLSRHNGKEIIVKGITAKPTLLTEVWLLRLDSGEKIKANDKEKFMLADGTWRELHELKSGDHLLSIGANFPKTVLDVRALGYKEQLYDLIDVGPEHCFALQAGVMAGNSATNAGYGARILEYKREIKENLPVLQRYYKGLKLGVV